VGDLHHAPLSAEPELFRALPGAARVFDWMPLGQFPTRVERVDGLLPRSVELWVKREDKSGRFYGGNKVRKLEFLLADARARGCTRLATFGGTGSHHVVATAIYGARAGFEVEASLFPQPTDDHVREQVLVDQWTGARLIGAGGYLGVLPSLLRACRRPATAWLAGGGSSPIGTLGWVSGGLEILAQAREGAMPRPDVVYGALGSCGTIAGLWLGLRGHGDVTVVGVRVVGGPFCGELATRRLARATAGLLEPFDHRGELPRLRVDARFLGPGYGHSTDESLEAVAIAAQHGLRLDPIYTGKVLAALMADARDGRLDGKRVLFVHSFNTVDLRPLAARAPGPTWLPPPLRSLFATVRR
jgi:1-aminocyclopropane-1-carboxylate deaminase/D-cysteine desulfhydrase-like pyridoxal-dependent ACC family enzyme